MRGRRIILIAGFIALALAASVALTPVWFPWVLTPILASRGVFYGSYHRVGVTRLTLDDVTNARSGYRFSAKEVGIMTPTAYLWQRFRGTNLADVLVVNAWQLEVGSSTNRLSQPISQKFEKTESIAVTLERWVSKIALHDGKVIHRQLTLEVPAAEWANGSLVAALESTRYQQRVDARVALPKGRPLQFHFKITPSNNGAPFSPVSLDGDLALIPSASPPKTTNTLSLHASVGWLGNNARVFLQYDPQSNLPSAAKIDAPAISIPAEVLGIPGYKTLDGGFAASWKAGSFKFDLHAAAEPLATNAAPRLSLTIQGGGDTNSVRVDTARIVSPWLTAELSSGLAMDFAGHLLNDSAVLALSSDLEQQPWLPVRGHLTGRAVLRRGSSMYPEISADLQGRDISVREIRANLLELQAHFAWPRVEVTNVNVLFSNHAVMRAAASADLLAHSILGGELRYSGLPVGNVLPRGCQCDGIEARIEASGAWSSPAHAGQIAVTNLKIAHLVPMRADVRWKGKLLSFDELEGQFVAQNARLGFAGSAGLSRSKGEARLSTLDLETDAGGFALERPADVKYVKGDGEGVFGHVEGLRWRGTGGQIDVDGSVNWPVAGDVDFTVGGVSAAIVQCLVQLPLPAVRVKQLKASAHWERGPVGFSTTMESEYVGSAGHIEAPAGWRVGRRTWWRLAAEPWALSMQARGDAGGVVVDKLAVSGAAGEILSGSGRVPIVLQPGRGADSVHVGYSDPLRVEMKAEPDLNFWEWLTDQTRFKVEGGRIEAAVNGTIAHPRGEARIGLERISMEIATNQPPLHAEAIAVKLAFGEHEIALDDFKATLQEQPIQARGRLPLPDRVRDWRTIFDWRKVEFQLTAPRVSLAAVARFAPDYLSPQGTARLDFSLVGGVASGGVDINGAASRPLPNVGPLQEIEAGIRFSGRKIVIERCSALLGGGPVAGHGEITISAPYSLAGARGGGVQNAIVESLSDFDLRLRGDSVPLVRRSDFILRAGFALRLAKAGDSMPKVSGEVTLSNGIYLSDLKLLAPGSVDKPLNRPPYFSIEREPFAHWDLDVAIRGTNFLRVRSPFFTGSASADFRLKGTLKEPLALGVARIETGVIQFPFANLKVTQGEVSLTEASPYLPHLLVVASSRVYNYDVRAQITGPADRPNLEFSSTPGLSPEQILLMLTVGELPLTDNAFSAQQRAGHIATYVGKNILSRLGLNMGAEDRLTLSSSPSKIEPGTQTYGFEYKLSEDWAITGDYDRFGGFNLGLRWRFYSK